VDANGTRAAVRAGYARRGAQQEASRLLSNVVVAAELAERRRRIGDRAELSALNTLEELRRILHFDPAQLYGQDGQLLSIPELPPEVRACISSFEIREIFVGDGENHRMVGRVTKMRFGTRRGR